MIEPQKVEEAVRTAEKLAERFERDRVTGAGFPAPWGADIIEANRANAKAIRTLLQALAERTKALEEIARIRTEPRGDFSLSSRQSDIARQALSDGRQSPQDGVDQPAGAPR